MFTTISGAHVLNLQPYFTLLQADTAESSQADWQREDLQLGKVQAPHSWVMGRFGSLVAYPPMASASLSLLLGMLADGKNEDYEGCCLVGHSGFG